MTEAEVGSGKGGSEAMSLKDKGNEFFKAGNYLKAAALYTQAIKQDPSNPTLYSNRAAAFLNLVKLNKAPTDAETTITLNPKWEKGYFRKGCILEAMEQYDDALAAFQIALQYNPQSVEVSRKIKRLSQLAKDKKRAQEVQNLRSNVDMEKSLETLKSEMDSFQSTSSQKNWPFSLLSEKYGAEDCWKDMFSFLVERMETAVKSWHETSKVDPRVYFLLDKEKTQTDKYAPVVNIDKVWKGQGSRKWRHGQHDGFFVQFESPLLRKLWFISSSNEMGKTLCRDPEVLDMGTHEVLPRLFKEKFSNSS
ncbi:hypothetical protein CRYUN_Cryun36dG0060300 [Craigia yunnanensis]